jgi:Holliday junction DNA helicase RuvA
MIYSLNGILTYAGPLFAVIDCGGVGFKCSTTMNTLRKLPKIGEKAMLHTYLNVREDALDLFGFIDDKELNCFKMLISVTGVGPKAAISILSEATPEKFALYVATGDVKALTKAQGVGSKIAQRIILELKDNINTAYVTEEFSQSELSNFSASGNIEEAINALMVLGYAKNDAAMAAAKCDSTLSVEDIIKLALKNLMR